MSILPACPREQTFYLGLVYAEGQSVISEGLFCLTGRSFIILREYRKLTAEAQYLKRYLCTFD